MENKANLDCCLENPVSIGLFSRQQEGIPTLCWELLGAKPTLRVYLPIIHTFQFYGYIQQ